jgi:hypothetical protein
LFALLRVPMASLDFFYAFISEFSSKFSMAETLPIFKSLRIIIKLNYGEGISLLMGPPQILILNEAKNIKSLSTALKIAGKKSILVVDDETGPS